MTLVDVLDFPSSFAVTCLETSFSVYGLFLIDLETKASFEVLRGGLAWSRLGDDFLSDAVLSFVVFFIESSFGNLTGDLDFFRATVSSATMLLMRQLVSGDG